MVNGGNIQRYVTKPPIAQFGYNLAYELEEARLHAQIDIATWERIPSSYIWMTDEHSYCKADYIVLYRLSQRLESVTSDVQNREIERRSRNAKMRRGN